MNIRKALMISFISFAFLVTGCSSKGIDSVQQIADEATCQKTMTKVQNNVNEKPKKRRVGRYTGLTNRSKRAIVTLKDGQTIDLG